MSIPIDVAERSADIIRRLQENEAYRDQLFREFIALTYDHTVIPDKPKGLLGIIGTEEVTPPEA